MSSQGISGLAAVAPCEPMTLMIRQRQSSTMSLSLMQSCFRRSQTRPKFCTSCIEKAERSHQRMLPISAPMSRGISNGSETIRPITRPSPHRNRRDCRSSSHPHMWPNFTRIFFPSELGPPLTNEIYWAGFQFHEAKSSSRLIL